MRWLVGLMSVVAVGVGSPSAFAVESLGYSPAGVTPSAVSAPGSATVEYSVTAPAGGAASTFSLRRQSSFEVLPALALGKGVQIADDGTGRGRPTPTPTLTITNVRLDGPGTLLGYPVPAIGYSRVGCVRDGVAELWGEQGGYELQLPGGQTTRILIDVNVPSGLYGREPVLELVPRAWQPTFGSEPTSYGAPSGEILQTTVPRTGGRADAVSLMSTKRKGGFFSFSGTVQPARRGQRVELVGGPPVKKASDPFQVSTLADALAPTGKGRRVLAEAKTNAAGAWRVRVRLDERTTVLARTNKGQAGTTTAGASCPILLAP